MADHMIAATPAKDRPVFLSVLRNAYNTKHKNVVLLTGDVHDIFWNETAQGHVSLEQSLVQELQLHFNLARMDAATGITFFDAATEQEAVRVCESTDGSYVPTQRATKLKGLIDQNRNNPLPTLILLKGMADAFIRVRRMEKETKPLCVLVQHAGALFPEGDYSRLSELDRQRLVFFLNWITDPLFLASDCLIVLVSDTMSELNSKIVGRPGTEHIEIQLPTVTERQRFVETFLAKEPTVSFETTQQRFIEDTAGLMLTSIRDLLGTSVYTRTPVTKAMVVDEVNAILKAQLGDIIRIVYPEHTTADIIGYEHTTEILRDVFDRCNDPETAVSAILVSGPNGGGKSFQLEAHAAESGRIVIELSGIRGWLFGQTDKFFEQLRLQISTYGKILIMVDEAHTASGSVHAADTHETEKRLSGNILKMMSDRRLLGKVLWALMTSRPDELDPDMKSRSPIQIPILDLEGEERQHYVLEMFLRKSITIAAEDLPRVMEATAYYSARDFSFLLAEVIAKRKKKADITVLQVLAQWRAGKSIVTNRTFQTLIAALHCCYPELLPAKLRAMDTDVIEAEVEKLKWILRRS